MSFLKTLGKILSVGEEVAGVFFPILRPFLGSGKAAQVVTTGVNDFTAIGSVITGVEAAFQTPGSATVKLQAALPQVANIVRTSEMLIGHKVYNEPEFVAGNQDLINALVRILNSYSDKDVKGSGDSLDLTKSNTPATPTPIKPIVATFSNPPTPTDPAGMTPIQTLETLENNKPSVHPLALSE